MKIPCSTTFRIFGRRVPELAWAIIASRPLAGLRDMRVDLANYMECVAPWYARSREKVKARI